MSNPFGGGTANQSGMINIKRDVQDPYYRYKMPRIQCKIEGKGNGIKTVLINLADVGKALSRPPSYLTKFFGAEVGALSQVDDRTSKYLVNGVHDQEKLQSLLDIFIQKFVLCPACENPETFLKVSKKDATITRTCQACGNRALVDMLHKLVTFIRANPPPKPPTRTQAKDRSEDAQKVASGVSDDVDDKVGDLGEDQISQDGPAPEEFEREIINSNLQVDEDDWAEEEADKQRQEELKELSASVKDKLSLENPIDDPTIIMENISKGWAKNPPTDDDVLIVADKLSSTELTIVLVIQALLSTSEGIDSFLLSLKDRLSLLERLSQRPDFSSSCQRSLLGSLERVVLGINGTSSKSKNASASYSLLPALNTSLQILYNSDIVDEEALINWKSKPSKRFIKDRELNNMVREACQPFFSWLEEAEESE